MWVKFAYGKIVIENLNERKDGNQKHMYTNFIKSGIHSLLRHTDMQKKSADIVKFTLSGASRLCCSRDKIDVFKIGQAWNIKYQVIILQGSLTLYMWRKTNFGQQALMRSIDNFAEA